MSLVPFVALVTQILVQEPRRFQRSALSMVVADAALVATTGPTESGRGQLAGPSIGHHDLVDREPPYRAELPTREPDRDDRLRADALR